MENCKHERYAWSQVTKAWMRLEIGMPTHGARRATFCEECGARLEPPKPEVMTLEEVAEEMGPYARYCLGVSPPHLPTVERWHRAITAHIEGEPRGLTEDEIVDIQMGAGLLENRSLSIQHYYAERLRQIAARHTKGGKQ